MLWRDILDEQVWDAHISISEVVSRISDSCKRQKKRISLTLIKSFDVPQHQLFLSNEMLSHSKHIEVIILTRLCFISTCLRLRLITTGNLNINITMALHNSCQHLPKFSVQNTYLQYQTPPRWGGVWYCKLY